MTNAKGVDVSNFSGVRSAAFFAKKDFAFAKATEGTGFKDSTFLGNWEAMKSAKVYRGAYHFFHPGEDPVAQAKLFVNTVKAAGLEPGDMLVADVEIFTGLKRVGNAVQRVMGTSRNSRSVKTMPKAVVNVAAKVFLDAVYALVPDSNPVLVYTNLNVGSALTSCTNYPLWIAHPGSVPASVAPWKTFKFWQDAFGSGLDYDQYNGTAADMKAWLDKFVNPNHVPTEGVHKMIADGKRSLYQLAGQEGVWTSPAEAIVLSAVKENKINEHLKEYANNALKAYNEPLPKGTVFYVW